jgi:hypothetical protein
MTNISPPYLVSRSLRQRETTETNETGYFKSVSKSHSCLTGYETTYIFIIIMNFLIYEPVSHFLTIYIDTRFVNTNFAPLTEVKRLTSK